MQSQQANVSSEHLCDCIERWFAYRKPCFACYDFDYSSILMMELFQLKRVRDSIAKYHNHENSNRDIERMNTAINLLETVICEDLMDDINVNIRNAKRFTSLELKDNLKYFKNDLYLKKAWYIYNKFKWNWLFTWWD